MKHFLLYLDLPPDYFEKRGPYAEPHMDYLRRGAEAGVLVLGGASVEGGVVQGIYLLKAETRAEVEAFAKADPYFQIAIGWRVVEWHTVAGPDAMRKS